MKKEITISYESTLLSALNDTDQIMVKKALEVCSNAYANYSSFKVGAVALLENGEVIAGSNQENIAYPSGLCAERVALFYAGANFPNEAVQTLFIVAKGDLIEKEKNLSPCGGCRQVMVETEMRQRKPFRVVLVNQDDTVSIFNSANSLLPLTFGL